MNVSIEVDMTLVDYVYRYIPHIYIAAEFSVTIEVAWTTVFGKLFQMFTMQAGKEYFRKS